MRMECTSTFTSFSHSLLLTFTSFSLHLLLTFSYFPFASLRLCAFAFSVLRFAPLRFLFSVTSVASRFPLQSTDGFGQTRQRIDVDPGSS
jgi:hypothetical protein